MGEARKVERRFGLATVFFIFLCSFGISAMSQADTLVNQNLSPAGRLTGKVIEVKDGTIALLLNDGAITRVRWAEVSQLAINDRVNVTLTSGEKIIGLLTLEGPEVQLTSPTLGQVRLAKEKILTVEREHKGTFPAPAQARPLEMAAVRGRGTQSAPAPNQEKENGEEKAAEPASERKRVSRLSA